MESTSINIGLGMVIEERTVVGNKLINLTAFLVFGKKKKKFVKNMFQYWISKEVVCVSFLKGETKIHLGLFLNLQW